MVLAVFTRCFKNLGQKWPKNGPKTGQKMAKIKKNYCHLQLETTPKNVTSRFHTMFGSRDTNFRPFLAKIGIFWVQISAEQKFVHLIQWLQVVYNIILHILLKNLENRQSRFFIKSKKLQKRAKRGKKGDYSKIRYFYQKKGHATFEPLWMPNFMPSQRQILRAFF